MLKIKWHLFNRRNEAPCDYECGSSNYQFLIPSRTFSPLPTNSLHKNDLPQRHPSTPYYAEPCHPSNKVPPLPQVLPLDRGLENQFSILCNSPPHAQRAPSVEIMTKTNPLPPLLGAQIPIPECQTSCHHHPCFYHKGRRRVQTSSAPAVVPLHLSQQAAHSAAAINSDVPAVGASLSMREEIG